MNILMTTCHPAQVHNLRVVRDELVKHGHNVIWFTTPKDIATQLLDIYHIPYTVLEKPTKSFFNRVRVMLKNTFTVWRAIRKNHIDIAVSRTDPYTSVATWLTRTPYIALNDTEHAAVKTRIFSLMSPCLLVADSFYVNLRNDQLTFPGNIELFYCHPNRYVPNAPWQLLGIEPGTRYAIVRFVKWDAFHDAHLVGGFTLEQKTALVERLSEHMRVFISSEENLPEHLQPYAVHIPLERMHDVLAHSSLFVGESSTMASEAVIFGTPAVYIDQVGRGYTDDEARHQLLYMFRPVPDISHLHIASAPDSPTAPADPNHFTNLVKNNTCGSPSYSPAPADPAAPTDPNHFTNLVKNNTCGSQTDSPAPDSPTAPTDSNHFTNLVKNNTCGSQTDSPVPDSPTAPSEPNHFTNLVKNNSCGSPSDSPASEEPWWILGGVAECIDKAVEIASPSFDRAAFAARHAAWMQQQFDCTAFLTWFIESYPESEQAWRTQRPSLEPRFK